MQRTMRVLVLIAALTARVALAKPSEESPAYTPIEEPFDQITAPEAGKTLEDTIWVSDWSFDAADGSCDDDGWVKHDLYVSNDGSNYWAVSTDFAGGGSGRIDNAAAVLRKHDLCWGGDGYANAWDYAIILKYTGSTATLAFKYIGDSEPGFDFITVEADSLGLSEARVNYSFDHGAVPSSFREVLLTDTGDNSAGVTVAPMALPDYGPGTHEAYIRFSSDGAFSPEDGEYLSAIGAAVVVDEIQVSGDLVYREDFEAALNPNVTFANTANATSFGEWARVYKHITDNDKCVENTTCAWLWSDPTRPAFFQDMAFGPGGAVIRNWLDDMIISPWGDLTSAATTNTTLLSFRRFGGNRFTTGPIVQGWAVRSKVRVANTDTTTPDDSLDCVTRWNHTSSFQSLTSFVWLTSVFDVSPHVAPGAREVQFYFRVADWGLFTGAPRPVTINPGPGPYLDRVRIGRRVFAGPMFNLGIDTRYQSQDRFPSAPNGITPGEHFSPTLDRFGTCDLSMGTDIAAGHQNYITGDSVTVEVLDARAAGGITSVRWYGAIVAGPHVGKAPSPYAVGANGFFEVTPDSSRSASGAVVANRWAVDFDDSYLRGGDQLVYYWSATDAGGASSSAPAGLTQVPGSISAAETATIGLFEMTALPAIDWSQSYMVRIAADAHGDLEPTAEEIQQSSQRNCILYYQHVTSNRRSGVANRTSFMRTLDALGYANDYDVFDLQGYGNTNNQLGARATFQQCTGYQLIVEDDGRSNLIPNIPDGGYLGDRKIMQATFYRNWLDAGMASEAGRATLWILGESTASELQASALLFANYCGASAVVQDQGVTVNPDVVGMGSFEFTPSLCAMNFAGDEFSLQGGCPSMRNFDGFTPAAGAVATGVYLYRLVTPDFTATRKMIVLE